MTKYIKVFGVVMVAYVLVYVSVVFFKPAFVMGNDGMKNWYIWFSYPLLYAHALLRDNSPHSGIVEYQGCNDFGDRVFFSQDGQNYGSWTSSKYSEIIKRLKPGEQFLVTISKTLQTSDDFLPSFYWAILTVKK